MTGSGKGTHHNAIYRRGEHPRNLRAQGLRVLRVRVDVHGPIGTNVRYSHRWSDRSVLQKRKLVSRRMFLSRFRERGSHVTVRLLARLGGCCLPVRIFFQELEQPLLSRQPLSSPTTLCRKQAAAPL